MKVCYLFNKFVENCSWLQKPAVQVPQKCTQGGSEDVNHGLLRLQVHQHLVKHLHSAAQEQAEQVVGRRLEEVGNALKLLHGAADFTVAFLLCFC